VDENQWVPLLSLCLQIYNGKNKMFAEIHETIEEIQNEMQYVIREIVIQYIKYQEKISITLKDENNWPYTI